MDYYVIEWGCIIIATIISVAAQFYIKHNYNKFSKKQNSRGITGTEAARRILDNNGLQNVEIRGVRGVLSDFYDPRNKTVNLSEGVNGTASISSVAIAAHECGHAIQDKTGYTFLKIRRKMVPFVNFASYAGYIAVVIGLFASIMDLVRVGVWLEMIILFFQIITLPVEFNASNRALKQIKELGLLSEDEYRGGKKVLVSAALTYVAAVASAVLQILRLLLILNSRRRD